MSRTSKATATYAATRHGGRVALAAALSPVCAVATILMVVGGAGANGQPPIPGCGGGGSGQQVGSLTLDPDQMGNARTINTVAAGRHIPEYGAVVAVATAIQESKLRNSSAATDRDSVGLFQQRPSQGWGTVAQLTDPVYATNAFIDHMLNVPNWQSRELTDVTATVQDPRADLRGAYAQWQIIAQQLVDQFWPAAVAAAGPAPSSTPSGSTPPPAIASGAPVCPGGGGAGGPIVGPTGNNVAGQTTIPAGLVIAGSAKGQVAVRFALQQLGKPYVFAASGPDAWDCSGLTMGAWAAARVSLPHWTVTQAQAGTPEPIDLSQAVGGDVVLIPGSDGTPQAPGHVGMVVGYQIRKDGRHLWLIQAPMTGVPVELTEATEWNGQVTNVRHIA